MNLFHGFSDADHPYFQLITECKQLYQQIWSSHVVYVPRNCNIVAHKLVTNSYSFCTTIDFMFLADMPASVRVAVQIDTYIYIYICNSRVGHGSVTEPTR